MIEHKHKLKMTKRATGSEKARFVCIADGCKAKFAFYGMYTAKETEMYVNKYLSGKIEQFGIMKLWKRNNSGIR